MNIERLLQLQKRASRIILKTDLNTPSADMFRELGWLPVGKGIDYNKAVLTYKALNNMAPEYITKLLTTMTGLGGTVGCAVRLETRRSRVQSPPRSATNFGGD